MQWRSVQGCLGSSVLGQGQGRFGSQGPGPPESGSHLQVLVKATSTSRDLMATLVLEDVWLPGWQRPGRSTLA